MTSPGRPKGKAPSRSETSGGAVAPTRRTQPERTAATRLKLLDAAIDCLAEFGYSATSTTTIAERAGVSRGALFYNFATKADVMVAVVDHIYQQDVAHFHSRLGDPPYDRQALQRFAEVAWEVNSSKRGIALLHIMVGAANDPELRPRLPDYSMRVEAVERAQRGLHGRGPNASQLVALAMSVHNAALRGLSVQLITGAATQETLAPLRSLLARYVGLMIEEMLPEAESLDRSLGN